MLPVMPAFLPQTLPATAGLPSLPDGYNAAVVGTRGAIGGALLAALQTDPRCAAVHAFTRLGGDGSTALDLTDEASIAAAAAGLRQRGPLHLLVCATGVLHLGGRGPEKRLADLAGEQLAQLMAVNAIGPALVIKHFHGLLPAQGRALLAVLSARVGSIGDNRLGGWYGYRASKAALNMLLRTAAVEIARQRPQAVLAALHPGTVRSPLSAPVIGAAGNAASLEPAQAARHLLAVLDAMQAPADGGERGSFIGWNGAGIEW